MAAAVLVLNGFVSLLIGFFCGAPLGRAINRSEEDRARAWRVAHSSLVSGGLMLLAIAATWNYLDLGSIAQWLVAGSLSLSLYAFSFALVVGAWHGHRGLRPCGNGLAKSIYVANVLGAALSTLGLLLAAAGALRFLLGASG